MPVKQPVEQVESPDGPQQPKKPRRSPRMLSPEKSSPVNSSISPPRGSLPDASSVTPTTSRPTSPLAEPKASPSTFSSTQEPPAGLEDSAVPHSSPESSISTTTSASSPTHKRRRDSPHRTPSPVRKQRNCNPSTSDSELSDLEATPPAPSPIRQTMAHLERTVECACTKACTCAKHSFHVRGRAPEHLGEWMLMGIEVEESAVRGRVGMGREGEGV